MASKGSPAPAKSGMSLYANLLDPSASTAPGSISKAAVMFNQPSNGDKLNDASGAAHKPQINSGSYHS